MRKPRDFDAELQALSERTRQLKAKRVQQLGELVIASGADALDAEILAGALLATTDSDPATREGWRKAGAHFFQQAGRTARGDAGNQKTPSSRAGGGQSNEASARPA